MPEEIKKKLGTKIENELCRVCEDPAAGFHFGVFTCEGCKSFFGRTYQKKSLADCKKKGECSINRLTRTKCKLCRLKKCFAVGMSKEASRYGRRSTYFKVHCMSEKANCGNTAKDDTYDNSRECNSSTPTTAFACSNNSSACLSMPHFPGPLKRSYSARDATSICPSGQDDSMLSRPVPVYRFGCFNPLLYASAAAMMRLGALPTGIDCTLAERSGVGWWPKMWPDSAGASTATTTSSSATSLSSSSRSSTSSDFTIADRSTSSTQNHRINDRSPTNQDLEQHQASPLDLSLKKSTSTDR